MLTIGQLAAHAGVTVRHYGATGLLPEPGRDASGYRRYDAKAVVDLVKIRTLADAGVPLFRVEELLEADQDTFASTAWRCRPTPSSTWTDFARSGCRTG